MGGVHPKLDFIYSYIYDNTLAELAGRKYSNKAQAEAEKYIEAVSKEFSKHSEKVLNGISKVSGLKWQKQLIDVYISKYAPYSMSVPLTIKIYRDVKVSTSILVHELVHNILFQNKKRVRYKELFEDFGGESTATKYHIIEGAILHELNKMMFSDGLSGFFEYDNWKSKKAGKEYGRAISIVIEKGPENIIKRYIVRIPQ